MSIETVFIWDTQHRNFLLYHKNSVSYSETNKYFSYQTLTPMKTLSRNFQQTNFDRYQIQRFHKTYNARTEMRSVMPQASLNLCHHYFVY